MNTTEIKRRLAGTQSIAKHGRSTPELTAARVTLNRLLQERRRGVDAERLATWQDEVLAACKAHDAACRAMGLPGVPASGRFLNG